MLRVGSSQSVIASFLFFLSSACAKAPEPPESAYQVRETAVKLEECNAALASDTLDANADGKPEIYVVSEGGRVKCRRVDLDLDGQTDRATFFDPGGQVVRVESDFDRDGRVDEIALYSLGVISEKHRATTLDGKLDTWEFYQGGRLVRGERDENGDGIIDQWWDYRAAGCPVVHVDLDADGRPDPAGSIDYCRVIGQQPAGADGAEPGRDRLAPSEQKQAPSAAPPRAAPLDSNSGRSPNSAPAQPAPDDASGSLPPMEGGAGN